MRQRELKGWRERERETEREGEVYKREREREVYKRERDRETQKFGCESALVKEGERLREYRD